MIEEEEEEKEEEVEEENEEEEKGRKEEEEENNKTPRYVHTWSATAPFMKVHVKLVRWSWKLLFLKTRVVALGEGVGGLPPQTVGI